MRPHRWRAAVAACAGIGLLGLTPIAHAEPITTYTPIPSAQMKAVATDSIEETGEGANGALELVLDGDAATYWHTKWSTGKDPLPHWFIIDLGQKHEDLGRVTLTPRQSSNGSGRIGKYKVETSADPNCQVAENVSAAQFSQVARGEVPANPQAGALAPVNIDFAPTEALCVRVTYESSWGGNNTAEEVATLAEFGASTAKTTEDPNTGTDPGDKPSVDQEEAPKVVVPEGALEITDGHLKVRTHPAFPQIVDYRLGDKQLPGQFGDPLTSIYVSGKQYDVKVGTATVSADGSSVTYPMTIPALEGVSFNVVISVKDQVLTYALHDIADPNAKVETIIFFGLDLVSFVGTDPASQLYAANISTNRGISGDTFISVAQSQRTTQVAYAITAANSDLAAGFATNAIGTEGNQLYATNQRYIYSVDPVGGVNVATVSPAAWVYRSAEVSQYDTGEGIGVDPDPMIQVKIVGDANGDKKIDWQDGATASRDILPVANGRDDVRNYVVMRIPFNIVSQATHPFLRTLDDTKRISLATDNLGQEVLLKGYQAEGHDSAQGDYGGNYNQRAGGLADMKKLVSEGKDWNATFGIHVNATESYSEANCFADANNLKVEGVSAPCEVNLPPGKAWGWMNQAYYMNEKKDLASGNVLKRLAQLREDFPADSNMNWLYWDVYYKHGWQAQRFAQEMTKEGWRLGSEWAYSMPQYSTWSHWATDENYGGSSNKGINSQLIRYIENSYRDTFNPDPMLGNTNVVEFEGWTGHVNYGPFIKNVWERNLPAKFLQQSNIRTWEKGRITFDNGTEVTSDQTSISGTQIPTQRTIIFDGATVFKPGGSYLLPWKNGGSDRLYYWNPSGAAQDWKLTDSFASQGSLTLFKLTDTGREKVADLPVAAGHVSIPATEDNTAYVLYPTSAVPAPKPPKWGQGSGISDPGFFSQTLDAYTTSGKVSIGQSDRGNSFAQLGAGKASLSQTLKVKPGSYSAWAWVQIEPGKTRTVNVSVSGKGVTPSPAQSGKDGSAVTTIHSSSAINATASDEKLRTYFQRVPVHFTTSGTSVTFTLTADEGEALVDVDDLRIVERPIPEKENAVKNTVVFEDFENVDTGYFPFVTGSSNAGGDARTQLAKLHAPFSQSGWYGIVGNENRGQKGQKYLDNVLDGQWSLLAHQENGGRILRTTQGNLPLEYGHTYQVSFDYQAAFDGGYKLELGHDEAGDNTWTEKSDQLWGIPKARGTGWTNGTETGTGTATFTKEFAVMSTSPTFLGVIKTGGQSQADLVIDNFRVVDLGVRPVVSITADARPIGDAKNATLDVTTTLKLAQGTVTKVTHALSVPEGWTVERVADAGDQASGSAESAVDSVATWKVTMPADAAAADIVFTATWKDSVGADGKASESLRVDPSSFPKRDLFKGTAQLEVVSVSSEASAGEPAPNGFATAAIDDEPATYWHSKWSGGEDSYPHELVLKVKTCADGDCMIDGLEFTQRQNAENGRVKGYDIFVSADGQDWGDPVASGDFTRALTPQFVPFTAKAGSFVKLVEKSPLTAGKNYGGAAEIRISGKRVASGETHQLDKVVAPTATDPATCKVKPFVTIPSSEGVIYSLNGRTVHAGAFTYEYGATVTVKVQAAPGFQIGEGVKVEWSFTAPQPGDCGGTDKPDKPGETDKPDKPGETDKPDKPGETDKPGHTDNPGETDKPGKEPGDKNQGGNPPDSKKPDSSKNSGSQRGSKLSRTGADLSGLLAGSTLLAAAGGLVLVRRQLRSRR